MISKDTGQLLSNEIDRIKQSIQEILSTPKGSRIMRRQFGSDIPNLIDQPLNDILILRIYSAIYTPLLLWEDRISIESIAVTQLTKGTIDISLEAVHMSSNQNLNLNIPLKMGAA
ncbi:GPW/gp25 family protein [Acinetobacter rathckeae]|uniref:GPW/gp25 family protein n=1 Tax=Acinetobacter rathckeae TaxID=2605272 RepID=UPI0018A2C1D4|nr:GPW/gp25 family protein [Acinetobacter rathckeae]MBF7687741.1 GPW/gp25 family protein [Acinetobacter rathckeae]MBF7688036.1 GPW/gp25 family protein [Acinetobacter rathckeae]